MELHCSFLMRGKDVANVCANFVVTGLKQVLNTKLKMSHLPKNQKSAHLEMEMRSKLRGIFMNHVYPVVKQEFGWLFEPINSWLENNLLFCIHILVVALLLERYSGQDHIYTRMCGLQCWMFGLWERHYWWRRHWILFCWSCAAMQTWRCNCLQSNTPTWSKRI